MGLRSHQEFVTLEGMLFPYQPSTMFIVMSHKLFFSFSQKKINNLRVVSLSHILDIGRHVVKWVPDI